jgi:hypothetical protein
MGSPERATTEGCKCLTRSERAALPLPSASDDEVSLEKSPIAVQGGIDPHKISGVGREGTIFGFSFFFSFFFSKKYFERRGKERFASPASAQRARGNEINTAMTLNRFLTCGIVVF